MNSNVVNKEKNRNSPMFSPLLKIRPFVSKGKYKLLLSDALMKKRILVEPILLLEYLIDRDNNIDIDTNILHKKLREIGLIDTHINEEEFNYIEHWYSRRWIPSLDYYLWSRDCNYYDTKKESSADIKREKVLEEFIADEKLKERIIPVGNEVTSLPKNTSISNKDSISNLLVNRRTTRTFMKKPCKLESLSNTLWYGLEPIRNTRKNSSDDNILDYLKSFGISFDFYFVIYSVEGIEPGVYFYDILNHSLIKVLEGDYRMEMSKNLIEQKAPLTASWTLCLVSDFEQYNWRYRHERALRNIYIEAGRIGQYLITAGLTYNLATLPTPAVLDKALSKMFKLDDKRQCPLYTLTMGIDKTSKVNKDG